MSQLIHEQALNFIIMLFCGVTIAISRGLFKYYQSETKPSRAIAITQEIIYWIFAALLTSAFLYYANYGAITFHGVAGFTIGAFMWYNISKL